MTELTSRRRALITGAAGGMGRACARILGATHDLVLTDVAEPALEGFAKDLRAEGYTVLGAHAGDLGSDAVLAALTGHLLPDQPFSVIHTAGLSPALAGWEAIMQINLVATEKLLCAIEPKLTAGTAVVVIASSAAHMMPRMAEADAVMLNPLAPDFMDRIAPLVQQAYGQTPIMGMGGVSYTFSKQAVLDIVRRRAVAWGTRARITSISPGMIATPMGKQEMEKTAGAVEVAQATPAGRTGTALDIALAARFLVSEEASFISGCDLQVDGGAVACVTLSRG